MAAWNAWRKKNSDIEVDLRGARLSDADLTGANLFGADVTGANLVIDAPERKQTCKRNGRHWACGSVAAQALRRLIRNRMVLCKVTGRDDYGRSLK